MDNKNNIPDLNTMYNQNSNTETINNSYNEDSSHTDISLNKEGLTKLYNQDNTSLDDELEEKNTPIIENNSTKVINNVQPSNNATYERITDDDLLEAYIGKNVPKLANKPFNFSAFFLTPVYMYFRKRLIFGWITYTILTILSSIMHPLIATLCVMLISGASFNSLYILKAKTDIERIKKTNKDMQEAKKRCTKKGGRSIIYIIIGIIIQVILFQLINILLKQVKIPLEINPLPLDFKNLIK